MAIVNWRAPESPKRRGADARRGMSKLVGQGQRSTETFHGMVACRLCLILPFSVGVRIARGGTTLFRGSTEGIQVDRNEEGSAGGGHKPQKSDPSWRLGAVAVERNGHCRDRLSSTKWTRSDGQRRSRARNTQRGGGPSNKQTSGPACS